VTPSFLYSVGVIVVAVAALRLADTTKDILINATIAFAGLTVIAVANGMTP